jgi:hypothetical protein
MCRAFWWRNCLENGHLGKGGKMMVVVVVLVVATKVMMMMTTMVKKIETIFKYVRKFRIQ